MDSSTCAEANTFLEFFNGSLSRAEEERFEAHVDACSTCRVALAELARERPGAPTEWKNRSSLDASLERDDPRSASGVAVGRYMLVDEIGSGGMGVVYLARDPELNRNVALKLLRSDVAVAGAEARARMRREAHAMAKLSHPNVVAVHDVGLHQDALFIAMELVGGSTLKHWLRQRRRPWRETVAMFVQAGRGLAAAHAVGIVHRDFKPDNVLVADDGRARVTDFGLAWVFDAILVEGAEGGGCGGCEEAAGARVRARAPGSDLTRGGAVLGTPPYMAPEQREGRATDARTDQYSFCVALYEGLHGARPNAPGRAGRGVPARIRRVLERGLHPEPEGRYPSMDALLADLCREPRVTVRRAAAIVVLAICTAAVVIAWKVAPPAARVCAGVDRRVAAVWDPARKRAIATAFLATSRPFAAEAVERVERALDAYTQEWSAMHTEACEATHVRGEQSAHVLDLRMRCLAARLEEVSALSELFATADTALVDRAVDAARTLTPLRECGEARVLEAVVAPHAEGDAGEADDLLRAYGRAHALASAGRLGDARAVVEAASPEARQRGDGSLEAKLLELQAVLLRHGGDLAGAEERLEAALAAAERGHDDATRALVLTRLAFVVGYSRSDARRGLSYAEQAEALIRRLGADPDAEARLLNVRALLHQRAGRWDSAAADSERAIAAWARVARAPSLEVASPTANLAVALHELGRYDEALARNLEAEAIVHEVVGRNHPESARVAMSRGITLVRLGRSDEALDAYRETLSVNEDFFGAESVQAAWARALIGFVYEERGDYDRALAEQRRALAIHEATLGKEHVNTSLVSFGLASVLARKGELASARDRLDEVLATWRKSLGPRHPDVAEVLCKLGGVEHAMGRPADALRRFEEARGIAELAPDGGRGNVARALQGIGEAAIGLGHPRDAAPPLERALVLYDGLAWLAWDATMARFALGRALWDSGADRARGEALVRDARRAQLQLGDAHPRDVARVTTWLPRLGRQQETSQEKQSRD